MLEPYIVVLGNEKGGTGKSTIAMHLIVSLLRQGARVASLDLDARQGTLSHYVANRQRTKHTFDDLLVPEHSSLLASTNPNRISAEQEDEQNLKKLLENYSSYDYIVIDTPGNDTFLSRLAHSFADTLITPLNDSFIDLDMLIRLEPGEIEKLRPSTYATMVWDQKKEKACRSGSNIDWIVLRNRLNPLYSKNKEEMHRILQMLSKRIGFRLLAGFCDRVIFRELFINGTTLLDLKDTGTSMTLSHVAARKELSDLLSALEIPVQKKIKTQQLANEAARVSA
ncbi:MAG: division plane positioning ATPase MipZ [Holosporales bacterium]|jgi:chromosome partitioning protein|nr:division plane positioning ATPase MipZ [Holosporales bacterium]